MDSSTHPYLIDADAEGSSQQTSILLIGTAVEAGLDPSTSVQKITRPTPGFRITEALAEALGGTLDEEPVETHDEDGYPLDTDKAKPEDWNDLTDEEKRAYVYPPSEDEGEGDPDGDTEGDEDPTPEPDLSGNKQSLAPEHDIHGEPTAVAYQDWAYQDLKSAVSTRGIEVENQRTETLIAALVADDAENADLTA